MYIHGKKNRKTNINGYQKISGSVTGQKIKFEGECDVEQENVEIKTVCNKKYKSFWMDWMEQFKLWNSLISLFCQEVKSLPMKQKV